MASETVEWSIKFESIISLKFQVRSKNKIKCIYICMQLTLFLWRTCSSTALALEPVFFFYHETNTNTCRIHGNPRMILNAIEKSVSKEKRCRHITAHSSHCRLSVRLYRCTVSLAKRSTSSLRMINVFFESYFLWILRSTCRIASDHRRENACVQLMI